MADRLYLGASAVADSTGAATLTFGPVPLGSVWTGSLNVPAANAAAVFVVTVGGPTAVTGATWGQWNGAAASPAIQAVGNESVVITGAGLLPGSQVAAVFTGLAEADTDATPIYPAATVPLFTQRFLGSVATAGPSGLATISGIQPSDNYLVMLPAGGTGITLRGSTGVSVNATVATIPVPAGVTDGDVLVMAVANSQAVTVATPAGWTLLDTSTNGTVADPRISTFSRIASNEPSSYNLTFGASNRACVAMLAYGGTDAAAPVSAHGAANSAAVSSATVNAPSVNAPAPPSQLVSFFAVESNSTFTVDLRMTERQDLNSFLIALEAADQSLSASGATGTRSATASAAGRSASASVVLLASTTSQAQDPLEIHVGPAGVPLASTLGYGGYLLGFRPLAVPIVPTVSGAVTINWFCLIGSRTQPSDFNVYATSAPLPPFDELLSNAGWLGAAAAGAHTILASTDQAAIVIGTIHMAVTATGTSRGELRFARRGVAGGDFLPVGIVCGAGDSVTMVYEPPPGKLSAASQAGGPMGTDTVQFVTVSGSFDTVDVTFDYQPLAF